MGLLQRITEALGSMAYLLIYTHGNFWQSDLN